MGDVNGLKVMNDTLGHAAGNELLIKTATVMKKFCRGKDIIARIGGDEFTLLLLNVSSEQEVIRVAELRGSAHG